MPHFSLLAQSYQTALAQEDFTILRKEVNILDEDSALTVHYYSTPEHIRYDNSGLMVMRAEDKNDGGDLQLLYYLNSHKNGSNKELAEEQVRIFHFTFNPNYLKRCGIFSDEKKATLSLNLATMVTHQGFKKLILCAKTKNNLSLLQDLPREVSLRKLYMQMQTQQILWLALQSVLLEKENTFVCKFLANEADYAKIMLAKQLLVQQIGDPITIKELSRKVGMNECYLKKGFKEITGMTVFEFFQKERMNYAQEMLCRKGASVTEVAAVLGYSSISHFSTAFKKYKGIKPCALFV